MHSSPQTDVIYFFTDTNRAAHSHDGFYVNYYTDLDYAQTVTGITRIIQTTEREFMHRYA